MECPRELLSLPVTAGARLTLVALWTFASPGKLTVWPSVRRLCELTGFADRSTRRQLAELEAAQAIVRDDPTRRGPVIWVLTEPAPRTEESGPRSPDRDVTPLSPATTPLPNAAEKRAQMTSPSEQTKTTPAPNHTRPARAKLAPAPGDYETRTAAEIRRIRDALTWTRRPTGTNVLWAPPAKIRALVEAGATAEQVIEGIEAFAEAIEAGKESRKDWRGNYVFSVGWLERIRAEYVTCEPEAAADPRRPPHKLDGRVLTNDEQRQWVLDADAGLTPEAELQRRWRDTERAASDLAAAAWGDA